MKITVAGHLCLDIIPTWQTGTLTALRPGSLVEMDGLTFSTGGAVANTGIALKRLGFEPTLIGRTGDDHVGEIIRNLLRSEHINPDYIALSPGEASSYTIVLNPPDTDRIFLHYPGTNDSFSADDVNFGAIPPGIFHFGYPPLMQQMYVGDGVQLERIFRKAKERGLVTSLDMALPDPDTEQGQVDWQGILQRIMPLVDLFLPSFDELLFMMEPSAYEKMQQGLLTVDTALLDELSDRLLAWGCNVVGIKLGAEGLYLRTGIKAAEVFGESWVCRHILAPIFEVKVQGTTGAGDTTIAGFLGAMSLGKEPEQVLAFANAVGAFCVEAVSSIAGIPHRVSVEQRIETGWKRVKPSLVHGEWRLSDSGVYLGPLDRKTG
jgi:sugar/nucleoside kinase (ribokinase family)